MNTVTECSINNQEDFKTSPKKTIASVTALLSEIVNDGLDALVAFRRDQYSR